jgi:hypothetical protein
MNFTILIYDNPAGFALRTDPKKSKAYWTAWPAYGQALRDAGVFVTGAALQPHDTATTVRLLDGNRQVQDGPYADSKEQLGGIYIIDVPNLDAALEWAARMPASPGSVVEVRPNVPVPGRK